MLLKKEKTSFLSNIKVRNELSRCNSVRMLAGFTFGVSWVQITVTKNKKKYLPEIN
jgi:hypothetical protein